MYIYIYMYIYICIHVCIYSFPGGGPAAAWTPWRRGAAPARRPYVCYLVLLL